MIQDITILSVLVFFLFVLFFVCLFVVVVVVVVVFVGPLPITTIRSLPSDRSLMPLAQSTVQWDPPSSVFCPADEYLVEYQLTNIDQCATTSDSPQGVYDQITDTEITLMGLLPHSTYRVSITAMNSGGAAENALSIDIQTEEASKKKIIIFVSIA